MGLDQELAAVRERAERAEEAFEALRHAVGHDLSAPARNVVQFTRLVAERLGERIDGRDREVLAHLENAGTRLEAMLEGLVRHVRLLTRPVEPSVVDVDELATQSVRARHIGDGGDSLPSGTRVLVDSEVGAFRTDAMLLRMVVHELLANAIAFGVPGEPNEVRVAFRREADDLVVEVSDTGTGMPHEHLDRAVRAYGRLVTESDRPGIGMGLTLVDDALTVLGGRLEHRDAVPHGAVFTARIPQLPEAAVATAPAG